MDNDKDFKFVWQDYIVVLVTPLPKPLYAI